MQFTFGNLVIDLDSRQVTCCQQPISLSCLEFNLLVYLAQNKNRVCYFDELMLEVWKYEPVQDDNRVVYQAVWRLRNKLKKCPCQKNKQVIRIVREIGYCFDYKFPQFANGNTRDKVTATEGL